MRANIKSFSKWAADNVLLSSLLGIRPCSRSVAWNKGTREIQPRLMQIILFKFDPEDLNISMFYNIFCPFF